MTAEDLAVYNRRGGYREKPETLRRVLLDSGRDHKCVGPDCELRSEWNGRPLVLEIDHINRDVFDNRLDNLRFLCPNCHSQTVGSSGRKGELVVVNHCKCGSVIDSEATRCVACYKASKVRAVPTKHCFCGAVITPKATKCKGCHQKLLATTTRHLKAAWPSNEELKKLLWEKPATQVAKDLGVTSVAVKKRCSQRGIETPPRGYWAKKYAGVLMDG